MPSTDDTVAVSEDGLELVVGVDRRKTADELWSTLGRLGGVY